MFGPLFNNLEEKDKSAAIESLISHSSPRQDFFLMVSLSVVMATFGLLLNNVAVIIGSMLIAPLLYPLLSLALGIVISDQKLISRSFITLVKSVALGVAFSILVTLFFAPSTRDLNSEIISRTEPSIAFATIALIAGFAATFAMVKPQLNETLPGVAISVALIPPLSVVGIGIARFDFILISSSLLLFLVNVFGIIFASLVVFSLMDFYVKKKVAVEAVKKDEKLVEREKKVSNQA